MPEKTEKSLSCGEIIYIINEDFLSNIINFLKRNRLIFFTLSIAILCILAILIAISTKTPLRGYLLHNSDNITLALYFQSIFENKEPISGLMIGTQGFFFPGYILYGLSYVISFIFQDNRFAASLIILAIMQLIIFWVSLFIFAKTTVRSKNKALMFTILSILMSTILLTLGQNVSGEFNLLTPILMTATHHFGIAIGTILSIALVASYMRNRKNINFVFLFILNALIYLSDSAWLTWFLLPFAISLSLLFIINKISRKTFFATLSSAFLGTATGGILLKIVLNVIRTAPTNLFSPERYATSLNSLSVKISFIMNNLPVLIVFSTVILLCVIGLSTFVRLLYKSSRVSTKSKKSSLEMSVYLLIYTHIAVAIIIIVALAIFSANADILRYYSMMSIFGLMSLIYIVFILSRSSCAIISEKIVISILVFIVSVLSIRNVLSSSLSSPIQSHPNDIPSCYNKNNLKGDIAGNYWKILSLNIYTDAAAVPIIDTNPYPWMMNSETINNASIQNISTFGINKKEMEKINSILPKPDSIIQCFAYSYPDSNQGSSIPLQYKIMHYNKPINEHLGWN